MASLNEDPGARLAAVSGLRGAYEPGSYMSSLSPGSSWEDYFGSESPYAEVGVLPGGGIGSLDPMGGLPPNFWETLGMDPATAGSPTVQNYADYAKATPYFTEEQFSSTPWASQGFLYSGQHAPTSTQAVYNNGANPYNYAPWTGLASAYKDIGDGNKAFVWLDKSGKQVGPIDVRHAGSFGEQFAPIANIGMMALAPGLGDIFGKTFGSGLLGQIGAGASLGGITSALGGGDIFKGALGGGVGAGVTAGLNSAMPSWGLNLDPEMAKFLSRAGGSAASRLATGQGLDGMWLAGQAGALGGAIDNGGTGVDPTRFDFNPNFSEGFGADAGSLPSVSGGGAMTDWASGSPFDQIGNLMPEGFGNSFGGGNTGGAPTESPLNFQFGFDPPGIPGPGFGGGISPPPASFDTGSQGGQDQDLSKFFGSPQGRMLAQMLSRINPKLGGLLGLAGGLGGGAGGARMGPWQAGLGALASMYGYNRANDSLKTQAKGLGSLYSPNSPYAQQLKQALARQDAASGRRSQYGTREVELQARLAELNSRNAPMLAQLNAGRDANRQKMLMDMLGLGMQSGAIGGLGNLFENMQTPFGPGVIG
jgi:hypothetical protein